MLGQVPRLTLLSVLEGGKGLRLLALGGGDLHLHLGDALLKRGLVGLGSTDLVLLRLEGGLGSRRFGRGFRPGFARLGKCLVLLGLDEVGAGLLLGGSGLALLLLETVL